MGVMNREENNTKQTKKVKVARIIFSPRESVFSLEMLLKYLQHVSSFTAEEMLHYSERALKNSSTLD